MGLTVEQYRKQYGRAIEWAKIAKGDSLDALIFQNDGEFLSMYEAYSIDGTLIRGNDKIREFLIKKGKLPFVEMPDGNKCYKQPQTRGCINIVVKGDNKPMVLDLPRTAIDKLVAIEKDASQPSIFESVVRFTKRSTGKETRELEWDVEIVGEAEWTEELKNLEFYNLAEATKPDELESVVQRLELANS